MNQVMEQNGYNILSNNKIKMRTSTVLILLFITFFTSTITAQETIWLDADGQQTSKQKAVYYRPTPKKVKNGYWISHYYKSGKLKMEAFSETKKNRKEKYRGIRKIYFETGELKEEEFYKNGKPEGIWRTFYRNGKIKTKGKYSNGEKVGVWKTFYKSVL